MKKSLKKLTIVIEKDADGFFNASVPSLRGCHTQAKSLNVLMKRMAEAIELCTENKKLPLPSRKSKSTSVKKAYPLVHFDKENEFVSIKLSSGIEKKSYTKSGIVFSENSLGEIIELQILDLERANGI